MIAQFFRPTNVENGSRSQEQVKPLTLPPGAVGIDKVSWGLGPADSFAGSRRTTPRRSLSSLRWFGAGVPLCKRAGISLCKCDLDSCGYPA